MGIENYEELVSYAHALNEAKEVLSQSSLELGNATYDEIEALIAEEQYSELTANMILTLYDAKVAEQAAVIDTSDDCANLIALAGDTDVTSKSIQLLIELMNIYSDVESGVYGTNTQNRAMALEKANQIKKELEAIANGETTKMEIEPTVKLGSKGKSNAKSAGKKAGDAYKEAYEAELKELEHMHKLGLISDEEYWKARMDLNEKYFGESSGMHEKYLDEYRDNEEDILEGIKNLWKDYYDDRKNDLKDLISYAEKLYDKEIDSLESSIEKLEERRDTEKKYWQSQIDDIDNEIDALEDANDERERAINLQEKQWALQQAMHQRTMLLYKDGQMVWVNDTKAERDARNDLDSAKHDNKVADLKKQQKDLQKQLDIILETYDLQIEAIEKQIDSLKEVKSAWSEIAENQELKELEERLKSIFGDDVKDKILSGNTDFMNSIVSQYSDTSDMLKTIEDATLADIQNMIAQYGMLPENLMPVTDVINDMADGFSNIAESASNAASAISGSGNVSARSNSQPSNNTSSGSTGGNTSSLKDSIAQASTGSVEEINKISDAFAGENEEGNSVTGAIQKVIDKVGSSDADDNDSDSLMSALSEQTTAALDKENGIPAQKTAWEELNEPLSKAVESVTTLQSTLEDMDGKEFTVTLNVVGGGAPNSIVSEFNSGASNSTSHGGGGSSRTEGNAYAEGTTGKYKGLPKAEKNALVSEYGQTEMTVLPNGKTIITDEPTLMDLPKDTVIFNEEQTKKIMDNKVDVSGNAHADGTVSNSGVPEKVTFIEPVYPEMDRWARMEKLAEVLGRDVEDLIFPLNSIALDIRKETGIGKLWESINNVNNVTNNSNKPNVTIGDIHVTCPGVTSQQVAEQLGGVIGKELDKQFSGFHNYVDQQSRIR